MIAVDTGTVAADGTMQRIFVVGCPRSGTTLVQAMLARHPDVFSLRETHFFEALFGDIGMRWGDLGALSTRRWYHHRMGWARSTGRRRLRQLEDAWLPSRRRTPVPRGWLACGRRYVALLDAAARAHQRTHWVEKTPNHLLFIDEIERCAPGARFVHVLRNGMDVVASVVDADLRLDLGGFRGGIAQWTRRWNRAMSLHRERLGDPRHYMICLEDLVADADAEWEGLRAFLDLDAARPLLPRPRSEIADVATEPWKESALSGVAGAVDGGKARRLFGPWSLEWLRRSLVDYGPMRARVHAQRDSTGAEPGGAVDLVGWRSGALQS